jgi:hypothetical protein
MGSLLKEHKCEDKNGITKTKNTTSNKFETIKENEIAD